MLNSISWCPPEDGVRNFRLDDFLLVNRKIAEYREILHANANDKASELEQGSLSAMWWLQQELEQLRLFAAAHWIDRAIKLYANPATVCSHLCHFFDEAIRAIDYQIKTEWTYHYGPNTQNVSEYRARWGAILNAFPSTDFEIESALDLFALQHFTASIFHFMRAAEHGLRVFASELSVVLPKDKPFTHANWQELINHCEKQIKVVGQTAPAGDAKDAALGFYSPALSHLHHLKDKYRNNVMHAKEKYTIDDAVDASRATKLLLELLATRLSERTRKKGFKNGKIEWGF
jgi:hypothetical protein